MAIYRIMVPDSTQDGDLRSIIWDDEAGTVAGDHVDVPWMQSRLRQPWPGTVEFPPSVRLEDPAHDPRDFWWLLFEVHWPMMEPPLDAGLPPVLRDVVPRPAKPMRRVPGRLY